MHVQLLGPVRVSAGKPGILRLLPSTKMRHLLALLAWQPNSFIPDEDAATQIWGEELPKDPRAALYTSACRLRRLMGTSVRERQSPACEVVRRNGGYMLVTEPGHVDLHGMRQLVRAGRSAQYAGRQEEAYRLFERALAFADGVPLADLNSSWADRVRWSLELELLATRLQHARLAIASGRAAEVLPALLELADRHPLDEAVADALVRALYLSGRQGDALDRYRLVRATLIDQLGQEPGVGLRDLHDLVLRRDPALSAVIHSVLP
ncbi:AfsR/SARP family transcriptional regulator [Streptomyces erythrochromogenes]|uniref:AfsR/SARP family transcriptional regulator n=1 Tax=Streptomyces erythrochromogenes TaxID=285574 RepID=UPI0033272781